MISDILKTATPCDICPGFFFLKEKFFLKKTAEWPLVIFPCHEWPHANLLEERLSLVDNIAGHSSFFKICGQRSPGHLTGGSNDMHPDSQLLRECWFVSNWPHYTKWPMHGVIFPRQMAEADLFAIRHRRNSRIRRSAIWHFGHSPLIHS